MAVTAVACCYRLRSNEVTIVVMPLLRHHPWRHQRPGKSGLVAGAKATRDDGYADDSACAPSDLPPAWAESDVCDSAAGLHVALSTGEAIRPSGSCGLAGFAADFTRSHRPAADPRTGRTTLHEHRYSI